MHRTAPLPLPRHSLQTSILAILAVTASMLVVPCADADAGVRSWSVSNDELAMGSLDAEVLPRVPVDVLLVEDDFDARTSRRFRVAHPQSIEVDLLRESDSSRVAGGTVHRTRFTSPGALFQSFKFSDFRLPEGAELWFVSVDRSYEDGPYTARHNRPERRFGSPMVPGESAILELFVPSDAGPAALTLESVSYGYRDATRMAAYPRRDGLPVTPRVAPQPRGGPFACQRDVNCPEGADYQDDKRAVAEGYDGQFICTGTMINNTREDDRYLYITAAHCEWWRDPAGMAYYWQYENSGCGTNDAPFRFSTGSSNLWWDVGADIHLLELDGVDIDETYDIWFAGWSRSDVAPQSGAILSFPADKPMQICIENDPVIDCFPGGCPNGWGPNFWRIDDWDVGTTEGGSSGGGLLDEHHRLRGVLTGGVGTRCSNFEWDEFAKIHPQWAHLAPYLDPDVTGVMSLDGRDHDSPPAIATCQGIDGLDVLTVRSGGVDTETNFVAIADSAQSLELFIDRPAGPGNGKFVAHLNADSPRSDTITMLPAQLGDSCFDFLIAPFGSAAPIAVWNRIGKADKVGSSIFFGTPIPDPDRAPTTFYSTPSVEVAHMPIGSRWTLQAVILNAAATSPKGVSVTEAVILEVH